MTLQTSLLALVLLVLCGGLKPAWADVPVEAATEVPVAPEAPSEVETEGEEEAIVPVRHDPVVTAAVRDSATAVERGSAATSVGTPPPKR